MKHIPYVCIACLAASLAIGAGLSLGSTPAPHIRTLVTSGAPAPAGLRFTSFGRAATNAQGTVCFLAGWDGRFHRREGLYLRRGSGIVPIARAGDPIPGEGGARFSFPPEYADEFASFSLNDRNEVAFITRQGLFLYSDGEIRALARAGAEVPDADDLKWDEIDAVSLNNAGAVAFIAVAHSSGDGERYEGVFVSDDVKPRIVQFVGDPVPEADGEINSFGGVSLSDSGQVATVARVGDEDRAAILLTTGSRTDLVALQGQPAPQGTWSDLTSVALNSRGELAFQARVQTGDGEHTEICLASGGEINAVALPGQLLDGSSGAALGEFLARPVLDDEGNVAFVAGLPGSESADLLVVATEGHRTALATAGRPILDERPGTIGSFIGLNLGSLRSGQVVASLTQEGGAAGEAVVRFKAGAPPEVLVSGETPLPPDGAVVTVDGETEPRETQAAMTPRGEVVFIGDVGGYGRTLFRLTSQGPALLTPLGQRWGDEPGLLGVVSFDLDAGGTLVFLGQRDRNGEDTAICVTSVNGEAPHLASKVGAPLPGSDQVLTRLGPPQLDGRGRVLFSAEAAAPDQPIDSAASTYLLAWEGGSLSVLAREGQRVEGAGTLVGQPNAGGDGNPPGAFRELQVNAGGQALFIISYRDSANVYVPTGLFLSNGGQMQPIALFGQRAPVTGEPTYNAFFSPRLSDDGTVLFIATLVGGGQKPRSGLFRFKAGQITPLAVTGEAAPGLPGALFRSLMTPVLSASGDLAFLALLQGTDAWRGLSSLYASLGAEVRPLLVPASEGASDGETILRLDDRSPAAPLALLEDRRLLVAGRGEEDGAPAGLFVVQPN
jgi:hypothetical protein